MLTIAFNVIKEKFRSKAILIVLIIGMLLMLLISMGNGLSINGVKITSFEQRIPVAIAINTFLGSILAMMTSIQTIPLEFERKTPHLILSRGIKKGNYTFALALGNIFTSLIFMAAINLTLVVMIVGFGRFDLLLYVCLSMLILSINISALAAIMSLLSMYIPSFINAIIGLVIYSIGVAHGSIKTAVSAVEGSLSVVLKVVLYIVPDLGSVQEQASSALLGASIELLPLITVSIFLYVALSLTMVSLRKDV